VEGPRRYIPERVSISSLVASSVQMGIQKPDQKNAQEDGNKDDEYHHQEDADRLHDRGSVGWRVEVTFHRLLARGRERARLTEQCDDDGRRRRRRHLTMTTIGQDELRWVPTHQEGETSAQCVEHQNHKGSAPTGGTLV